MPGDFAQSRGPAVLVRYLEERRQACAMTVIRIPLREVRRWAITEGRLGHRTGAFFSVIGVRDEDAPGAALDQPLIDQPEIGILGALVRTDRGEPEILVQAKPEPGNVGGVQLAPTVQATVSNYMQRHGGAPTPYLDHFRRPAADRVVSDSLQSEQGTRFLGKYNRNLTVLAGPRPPRSPSDWWCWAPVRSLLAALVTDFAVNTDLRSVLAVSDWELLAGEPGPFARHEGRGGLGEGLFRSYPAVDGECEMTLAGIGAVLARARAAAPAAPRTISLEALTRWSVGSERIVDHRDEQFEIAGYRVYAPEREVPNWDQPLIRDLGEGEIILVAQRRRGILHFLLRAVREPGFVEKVQFGPSLHKPPTREAGHGPAKNEALMERLGDRECIAHLDCRYSEEGGRFFASVSRYRVIELPASPPAPAGAGECWATLGQIRQLLRIPGSLTNEARSAVALLMTHL